ncbi:hypothetical protein NM688_g6676 [Phlebia brevispora]|uniref:Uncharacterized protein n=1 Tax=Phlebia brevispora TaxID=194682 RepID=A0ACC1SDV0_9APHY|nr:hypothetical protein NM688_g6676 [Phlebia brevispora]
MDIHSSNSSPSPRLPLELIDIILGYLDTQGHTTFSRCASVCRHFLWNARAVFFKSIKADLRRSEKFLLLSQASVLASYAQELHLSGTPLNRTSGIYGAF